MSRATLADFVPEFAAANPDRAAAVLPRRRGGWIELSYGELDARSRTVAAGLADAGLEPGTRVALMVPPTRDFFVLAFGLLQAGVVPVLVDPGIGRRALATCLREAAPEAFVGVGRAVLAARALRWCPDVRLWIAVGTRLPGGPTLEDVEAGGARRGDRPSPALGVDDVAAVVFTSGSTGTPKGVIHRHRAFLAQRDMIAKLAGTRDGDVNVATFPPFALFGPAMGTTTVIPRMDPTRPGSVDPRAIVAAVNRFGATSMFGSPALLDTVARGAAPRRLRMPGLRRVLSAGAPVPREVQARFLSLLGPDAEVITPYGATEALPVTSVSSRELLTLPGPGICVGRPVDGVEVRLVEVDDAPMADISPEVPTGEVGEVVVRGPNVSDAYLGRPEADALAKTRWDGQSAHRMGDLAWRDGAGRLWFAGRKSDRVVTPSGTLDSVPVEEVFNAHQGVRRTALVGVGGRPVLCVELPLRPRMPRLAERLAPRRDTARIASELLALGARDADAAQVRDILFHPRFPVDIRHNSKIGREQLARWAAKKLR